MVAPAGSCLLLSAVLPASPPATVPFYFAFLQGTPTSWPRGLVALLNDHRVLKAGVNIAGDIKELQRQHLGLCANIQPADLVDVSKLHAERDQSKNKSMPQGLKPLAQALLFADANGEVPLPRMVDHAMTLSDWARYPLQHGQQIYAALDAILSQALCTVQLQPPKVEQSAQAGAVHHGRT